MAESSAGRGPLCESGGPGAVSAGGATSVEAAIACIMPLAGCSGGGGAFLAAAINKWLMPSHTLCVKNYSCHMQLAAADGARNSGARARRGGSWRKGWRPGPANELVGQLGGILATNVCYFQSKVVHQPTRADRFPQRRCGRSCGCGGRQRQRRGSVEVSGPLGVATSCRSRRCCTHAIATSN